MCDMNRYKKDDNAKKDTLLRSSICLIFVLLRFCQAHWSLSCSIPCEKKELSYFKAHICFIKIDVSVINFRTNNFRNRSNLFRSLSEFTVIYMSRSRNDHVKKPKHFYINKSYVYLLDGKHATGMNFVHTFYSIEQQSSPHYSLCV